MVTTRYSDQQGSKSRQKVMRLYKQGTDQYQNGSSNLLTPCREQPRLTRNVVAYPRPAFSARHQLFPQKPPCSSLWFSRTGVQPSPGSSTIELPSASAESGACTHPIECSLPLACRHPPEGHQIGARKRHAPGNTILSQSYRRRVSTDRLNREGSQLAASLEGEPGPTPAGKTLPHSYPETRFRWCGGIAGDVGLPATSTEEYNENIATCSVVRGMPKSSNCRWVLYNSRNRQDKTAVQYSSSCSRRAISVLADTSLINYAIFIDTIDTRYHFTFDSAVCFLEKSNVMDGKILQHTTCTMYLAFLTRKIRTHLFFLPDWHQ